MKKLLLRTLLALMLLAPSAALAQWGGRPHYWYFRRTAYWYGTTYCVFADVREQVLWNPAYTSAYGRPYCPRYIVTY